MKLEIEGIGIKSVYKALGTYDNITVMGDFNIDIKKDETIGHDKLDDFCDTLNLTNLVKSSTCYTNNHKSTIDLFLTNKPLSFQFTSVTETGLSDYHRLITIFMMSHFSRLKPKIIHYRNFKAWFPPGDTFLEIEIKTVSTLISRR